MGLRVPRVAVLELTYKCNHQCKFCSCPWDNPDGTFQRGIELTTEQWISVIRRLYDLGVTHFSISGGEALLKRGLADILTFIHEEGVRRGLCNRIVLISNGRNMNEEYLQLFIKNNVSLSMSLPGYETFAWHTGYDNADGVLQWFKRGRELGMNITANITVTTKNYYELFQTMSLALINGAHRILLNRFLPGGRGLQYRNELELSRDQIVGMLDTAEEVLGYANRYASVGTEIPLCIVGDKTRYKHIAVGSLCAAGSEFFVIGPAGEVRVCNHSPRVLGNIMNENFIEDVAYWTKFAERKYKPAPCHGCHFIDLCDCGCREVANIVNGSPCALDTCIPEDECLCEQKVW